jgi:hypothetical protein
MLGNVMGDLPTIAARFREVYTLVKMEVPVAEHVFIHRLINNVGNNPKLAAFGHVQHESVAEMLRIIANDLRGEKQFMLAMCKCLGLYFDEATDIRQVGHCGVFGKIVYPPPVKDKLPTGLLLAPTSYLPLLVEEATTVSVRCNCRRPSSRFIECSSGHSTCQECALNIVFFFIFFLITFSVLLY